MRAIVVSSVSVAVEGIRVCVWRMGREVTGTRRIMGNNSILFRLFLSGLLSGHLSGHIKGLFIGLLIVVQVP